MFKLEERETRTGYDEAAAVIGHVVENLMFNSDASEMEILQALLAQANMIVLFQQEQDAEYADYEAFLCMDCGEQTGCVEKDEYYMVHDEVWLEANPDGEGMLCIGCLEERLGRTLTAKDFKKDVPLNRVSDEHTDRLNNRLMAGGDAA